VKAHAEALAVWSQFELIDQLARRTITHSACKHELDVQVVISNRRRHAVEARRPTEDTELEPADEDEAVAGRS
jgi:hypothetical protein